MGITLLDLHEGWQDRPLCCRYLLAHFTVQPFPVQRGISASNWPVTWALGALSDGQPEVVGVWPHSVDGVLDWQAVFDELAARGVERIRYPVHVDAAAAQASFPDVAVINSGLPESREPQPSAGQGDPRPTETLGAEAARRSGANSLPPRVRLLVRRVEDAAQMLRRGVSQAANRHGPFESGPDAAAFLQAWLTRAEHRQRMQRLAMQRRAYLRAAPLTQ